MDSTIPASKNGIGRINGPTPNSKFTEVNNAEYFVISFTLLLSLDMIYILVIL
jgi:hypothetical protein